MTRWRFLTWVFGHLCSLYGNSSGLRTATAAVILFYILPYLQNRAVQSLVVEYPRDLSACLPAKKRYCPSPSATPAGCLWRGSGVEFLPGWLRRAGSPLGAFFGPKGKHSWNSGSWAVGESMRLAPPPCLRRRPLWD